MIAKPDLQVWAWITLRKHLSQLTQVKMCLLGNLVFIKHLNHSV